MNINKLFWLKYLAPLVHLALCPVTILFLWSYWVNPFESRDLTGVDNINQLL